MSESSVTQNEEQITKIHLHDVISAKGNYFQSGNIHFRNLIRKHALTERGKAKQIREVAEYIVDEIMKKDPPGRFLKRDGGTGYWLNIGYGQALQKTRSALINHAQLVKIRERQCKKYLATHLEEIVSSEEEKSADGDYEYRHKSVGTQKRRRHCLSAIIEGGIHKTVEVTVTQGGKVVNEDGLEDHHESDAEERQSMAEEEDASNECEEEHGHDSEKERRRHCLSAIIEGGIHKTVEVTVKQGGKVVNEDGLEEHHDESDAEEHQTMAEDEDTSDECGEEHGHDSDKEENSFNASMMDEDSLLCDINKDWNPEIKLSARNVLDLLVEHSSLTTMGAMNVIMKYFPHSDDGNNMSRIVESCEGADTTNDPTSNVEFPEFGSMFDLNDLEGDPLVNTFM